MVEAGGQHIHSFRCGLDYAFILLLAVLGQQDAERVMPRLHRDILVSARKPLRLLQRVYESLQGRPEVGLLPTPRRYHAAVIDSAVRLHRCELRSQPIFTDRRDP